MGIKMKLSVIVPVYNTVQYLQQCIESIIHQTYKNIEIILVDDGSCDGSEKICDEYAASFGNIRAIHQENSGNVAARRRGTEEAAGDYLTFLDSDDWIAEDLYEELMRAVEEKGCDIVASGGYTVYDNGQYRPMEGTTMFGTYAKGDNLNIFLSKMMYDEEKECGGIVPSLCCKVIKRGIVTDVMKKIDSNILMGGDAAIFYPCCVRAESICVIKGYQYYYRMREMSVSHSYDIKYFNKIHTLYQYFKNDFSDFEVRDELERQLKKYLWYFLSVQMKQVFGLEFKNVYLFPYQCIDKGSKIILYGAGKVGQSYYDQINKNGYCDIVAWSDSNTYKENGDIIPPMEIVGMEYSKVVIAIKSKESAEEIIQSLVALGVDRGKIIWAEPLMMPLV